ncbi:MAG: hypothetical protein LBT53_04125 [Puniceicoccales bacterium]|jgi:beta-galactosidase/beta-glucuronidase|nr:hypothetical protein [Puniceicoccales bacterium]
MKKQLSLRSAALLACALAFASPLHAQWKPAGDKIKTKWAAEVSPDKVLPEYPRPRLVRDQWQNLNGLWDYAIATKGAELPATFEGKILVPFCIESSLSGVQKTIKGTHELWYKREFTVPAAWAGKNIAINFGAVDWKADVFVNDKLVGSHSGGYTPFSFDITPHLAKRGANKLVVRVWDPTDTYDYARGKQISNPHGIWYTAVTGIWQTVWLEPVAPNHITDIKAIPDIDSGVLAVTVSTSQKNAGAVATAKLLDKSGRVVASAKGAAGTELALKVANPLLWDTQTPNLYDLTVALSDTSGAPLDSVRSYAAFRKISKVLGADGVNRLQLNNKTLFQFGPLDQGWWPDGLYTAPTDEALLFDIKKTKEFGFNLIRKHVKVEPARWYYHCDREGILVWQDMPSTGGNGRWDKGRGRWNAGRDHGRIPSSVEHFYKEWGEIIDLCISHPSVVAWVPFNEGWGQWATQDVAKWTAKRDPSRLVNSASGGNYRKCGDILDIHHYPNPTFNGEPAFLADAKKNYVVVLGEYGGIGRPVPGHLWWDKRNWGYVQFGTEKAVTDEYVKYIGQLKPLVKQVYAGAIYTQTTDVEGEVNGLITYDRKVIKLDIAKVRKANQEVINGK